MESKEGDGAGEKATVIMGAFMGQGHMNALLSCAAEFLRMEGYAVYFLVNKTYRGDACRHFASLAPELASEFAARSVVEIDEETTLESTNEVIRTEGRFPLAEFGEARLPLVEKAIVDIVSSEDVKKGPVLGLLDFMSLAEARTMQKLRIPYWVTMPGPPEILAYCGCKDCPLNTLQDYALYVLLRVVPMMRRMLGEFRTAIPQVCDSAEAIFTSSFRLSTGRWCCDPHSPRLQYIRTFSPRLTPSLADFFRTEPKAHEFLEQTFHVDFSTGSTPTETTTATTEMTTETTTATTEKKKKKKKKPVIFVGGTSIKIQSLTPQGLAVILKALRRGRDIWNVIWRVSNRDAFKQALEILDHVSDGSAENKSFLDANSDWFLACDWVPQVALLMHPTTRVFCYHMGWNGTTEALAAGVPILATPIGADQPVNAAFAKRLGVALVLDTTAPRAGPLSPPPDYWERPAERIAVDDVFDKLNALLDPDSSYQKAAAAVKARYFDAVSDQDCGPTAVIGPMRRRALLDGCSTRQQQHRSLS